MARQPEEIAIGVVGRFSLVQSGSEIQIPPVAQRPVAFLAAATESVSRRTMAERLWPDTSIEQALERLRKAVWRVNNLAHDPVVVIHGTAEFADHVRVDLREARDVASDLFADTSPSCDQACTRLFEKDLLTDWEDEWLDEYRQRYHVLRLHALEHLAQHFLDIGQVIDAERTCLAIVKDDPFRESAQLLLADIYVAQRNPARALQRLNEYGDLLQAELGLLTSESVRDAAKSIRLGR